MQCILVGSILRIFESICLEVMIRNEVTRAVNWVLRPELFLLKLLALVLTVRAHEIAISYKDLVPV